MRGAFNKDVLRSVTHSLGRFLAIAGIVALGTGFYAGLRMTAPDMKLAADQFYDGTNLMDIRVVSTLGLTDDDLAALRGVEGVAQVMGAYETDVMATVNDEQYAIRVHSLPAAAAESDTGDGVNAVSGAADYLNRPVLVEGSWPVREGECVLSADKVMNTPTKIGDTVQITEGSQDVDDVLATRTYQVVGYVHSSYYVSSTSMGTTSLGSGSVQQFMYVPESDFSKDLPYTEAFVTVAGAAGEFSGSDAYFERVHEVEDRIEALAPAREQARADGLRADAQKELDEKRADYERERADAERQIADAQQKIDDLENPSWLVMDRDQNYGVASFESDANRVDSIAQVFPFIFFLVAALVALTTMTRMVEEERVLIGTFKALGYSRARIASKYLLYAAVASVTGSVLGIAVLSQVLPAVISEAYAIIYFVPHGPLPIDLGLAGLAAGLGVGVTLVATWAAVFATLRERPATLMLPRAPKAGKRILLERIAPLWRRLSFSWKVTFRNLFRYKKRFVMTVIGIAGCTALLLTGLGLQDAINDIIDKQYGEIVHYNAVVTTEDDLPAASQQELDDLLGAGGAVESFTRVQSASMVASGPDKADVHASVVVPEDPGGLADFLTVRTRVGHEPLSIGDDGVVLAEKLANELGVGVGDTVRLAEQDEMGNATDKTFDLTVTGVMENYIYNYVFIGPGEYARMQGGQPAFSTYYAVTSSDAGERAQFNDAVRAIDGVKTVAYNDEVIDAYKSMLKSVGLIVIVLVVAAAALAFIVLYNLTNINITERMREIATLKVLGFTPREMNAYIFREIFLLAAIGCAVGLVLGVWMEGFVVVTAEVDQIMFGRAIHPTSFLLAFLLTMLFTVLVMLAMRGKLRRIDMVESLKSNE